MLEEAYKLLLDSVNRGKTCVMLTDLHLQSEKSGEILNKVVLTDEDIENKTIPLEEDTYQEIKLSLNSGKIKTVRTKDKVILIEPFAPKPRLIIFGGGHIAKPLAEFAARVGFAVTLIDDRPSFANAARFPDAENVICDSFENCFKLIDFNKSDYVVIITRGHRHDGTVLRQVLMNEFSYVGMIGSKRRVKGMIQELLNEGYSKEKLDSINAPIGLDIGAITPDEIAISIAAQLISFKNKRDVHSSCEKFTMPEFDKEVAEIIMEKSDMPRALLTILSSKGSVPRKAGAKMVAYLDGRTVGSIGGGCSEAEVIRKARDLMRGKGFLIEDVDMTGDVAESEGMVCGGVMEVIVEVI